MECCSECAVSEFDVCVRPYITVTLVVRVPFFFVVGGFGGFAFCRHSVVHFSCCGCFLDNSCLHN